MILIEILGWVALAFIVACVAGFVSGTFKKNKTDSYHRSAMEELVRDSDLDDKLSQLRQAASTSESPALRELAEKLVGKGHAP